MLPVCGTSTFSVLLLLFFMHRARAVCTICFGSAAADGCVGNSGNCPWSTIVANNAGVVTAAVGGTLSVMKLLPSKVARLFPRHVLDAISALAARLQPGQVFDPNGKTEEEIHSAVKIGSLPKDLAHEEIQKRIFAIADTDTHATIKLRKLEACASSISRLVVQMSSTSSVEGVLLYILYKLSAVVCRENQGVTSFDMCGVCPSSPATGDNGIEGGASGHGTAKSFSASLTRPPTSEHASALFNLNTMVTHAAGVAHVLAMTSFLEDVFYEPIRRGQLTWQVAFECVIIYLRMIEADPGTYTLKDVVAKAGGIDAVRTEAREAARTLFPPSPKKDTRGGGSFEGQVVGDTPTCKKGCVAWNNGLPHLARNVTSDNRCIHKHACNQWVTDKGPNGQCLGNHKRAQCNYEASKRCEQPVRA